jgi:hypothetical protein
MWIIKTTMRIELSELGKFALFKHACLSKYHQLTCTGR